MKFNKTKLRPITAIVENLERQLKEAKQTVIDLEEQIKVPRMEFDFVEWCRKYTFEDWLDNQNLISSNHFGNCPNSNDTVITNNHHLSEKIITWQIEKYIEKYDNGWEPEWCVKEYNYYFYIDKEDSTVKIDFYTKTQSVPNSFYFSEKVAEKIKDLPEILEREYGVCIFKYWLTGEI